jgi:hypothetical protein
VISIRPPPEIASAIANCWKTRTGSSVLITDTPLPRMICFVAAAAALMMDPGDDPGISRVWCSPTAK